MRKIYALKDLIVYIFALILVCPIALVSVINDNKFLFCFVATFIVAFLSKIFIIPSYIEIENNWIKSTDSPFWATNRFYGKKQSLISWNNNIDINEVISIDIVKLTRKEKKRYIGYVHLLDKYLKFNLRYGKCKYVYVGNYTEKQINSIIKLVEKQC